MYTYQDLEKCGGDEQRRMALTRNTVAQHQRSPGYLIAADAECYYAKKNPTILQYQKVLRNALGQTVPDVWSANYKLVHGWFRIFVLQLTQYVLSNGVSFACADTKKRLGADFDNALQRLTKKALVDGVAFGFWNFDRLEVFGFVDTPTEPGFAPLYDEDTGLLRAGVRYWQPNGTSHRWTLYEPEGYTDYIRREGEDMMPLDVRQPYVRTVRATAAGGVEAVEGGAYPGFPILPLYANDLKESELVGIRPSIDCYDFIMSGMANNIDETSVFYWTLKGTGGMDDTDLAGFVRRMRSLKAAVLERGVDAEAHTLDVPVEANRVLLDYLKNDMYENMMLMNPEKALSGNMTATAIRLAYQQQDDRSGDLEFCIRTFLSRLLQLLGIQDEPAFQWNRIANQTEETQMIMTAAAYLDEETVLRHLPWLTPEEADDILRRRAAEGLTRFSAEQEGSDEPPEDVTEDG